MKKYFFAMVALGISLGGMAHATNQNSCSHSQQQNQYHCTMGDTVYVVEGASSEAQAMATATAKAEANATSVATGGNATGGTAVSGSSANQSMEYNEAEIPRLTGHVGVNIGINATILNGVEHANAVLIANALSARGLDCAALKVLLNTPQAKRAGLYTTCE